jgi:hypothetical protein
MAKHLKQEKRELLYWATALQDIFKLSRQYYKGKELTWLDSVILSCDAFARAMFEGVDAKEATAVLNFSRTVRPILYTDQLHANDAPAKDIVKCNSDDIFGIAEYALEYCVGNCKKDYDTCQLREHLRNLQVPPWNEKLKCEYEREG